MKRQIIFRVLTAVLLVAATTNRSCAAEAAHCGDFKVDDALFCLGIPDGSAMEFGLTKELWPAYQEKFPKPIEVTIGKSPLREWPYIHPSTHDKWAGSKSHTFTIRFHTERVPSGKLYLTIGAVAIWEPSLITITVNGKQIASQRLPREGLVVEAASNPDGVGKSQPLVFALPEGAVAAGDNLIGIKLDDGSWIIYDYILLGARSEPPKLILDQRNLLDEFRGGAMAGVEDIVFAARQPGKDGHWYANFGYYGPDANRKAYGDGGKLYRLNLNSRKLTTLLDDPQGGVRDPQVHYDGKKILFSYRKGGTPNYLLYEINTDGTGLRQLTDGVYDDIEPTYLPDGDIIFVSSRCKRWVNCWLTQVAVLHRCDASGQHIRVVSSNNEHDNTPWPLPDGRILYTRWEYVDRSQVHFHHLWAMNPDGTGQMVWFGNLHGGITMIDAKPIPGTEKIVASFSPGHGQREHDGEIAIVDPKAGPDAQNFARVVSHGSNFRDPWAFSEDCFLAAAGPTLAVMDGRGKTQTIVKLSDDDLRAGLECHEPRPLVQRARERVIQPRVDLAKATGSLLVADIYNGRNMTGIKPGEIKKLLVLESLPMPIHYTGGMDPISYGGTFTLERVLGTVPVEPDGSAYFEAPALHSLIFIALDENNLSVKRMQSFATVQPGEVTSCVGCHEHRALTPKASTIPTIASRRGPTKIEPYTDAPDVFDFPRDIQPILNALCVDCHGYEKTARGGPRAGRLILAGDHGPMFSHGYYMMTIARLFSDGRNQPVSNYAPRTLGSSASKILTMLDGSHYGVQATLQQKRTLRLWIETGAPNPGTYAALACGMIGNYIENNLVNTDFEWPTTKAAAEVIARRCAGCHNEPGRLLPNALSDERGVSFWQPSLSDPRLLTSRHIVFNLSRPDKSLMLLAPLAEKSGGWGLCRNAQTKVPIMVFADTYDPDYQKLLAMVVAGQQRLDQDKRFDMPGFRPRPEWVREMKRYKILPADLKPDAPIDVYSTERKYWESLWYRPAL